MRAALPTTEGITWNAGVAIHHEIYGEGDRTLFLMPPSPICYSRIWKGQIPHLSRRFRVITFDGRGSGGSDRPSRPEEYTHELYAADALAVLDGLGVERVVLISHCHAGYWALQMAAAHPERTAGWVAISPGVPHVGKANQRWIDMAANWEAEPPAPTGWDMANASFWRRGGYRAWNEFFYSQMFPEPHSTKQREDAVGWALEVDVETMIAAESAPGPETGRDDIEQMLRSVRCPVLVIHGSDDGCQLVERGRAVADLAGGEMVELEGAGHIPPGRDPVKINGVIEDFVHRLDPAPAPTRHTWARGPSRRRKALYVSSPIGLGHARRDVVVGKELQKLAPDLEIHWLAQDPVTRVLEAEGETIHPASEWLVSESAHMASEASGHDLHCFQALRRMDEILVTNFMVFQEVVEEGNYDVVISDEAWEIDHFWHENPELKRGSHVWFTDFVGFLPMPEGGDHEAFLTADYNAEMIEHIARYPRIRDRALFVGNPDDVIPESFGPGLPKIKEWTEDHFDFCGYITGFSPPSLDQVAEIRDELGFDPDEKVVVVTVGGSGVGRALLDKVIAAFPGAKQRVPELRMIAVAGPRIDPGSLPRHEGLEVHGYVDRLYRYLAACDLGVVQGGLTTTMELTAARRPFLYFPLRNHFEQNYHVRYRLDRYGAGTCLDYAAIDPDELAEVIADEAGAEVSYAPVESDGASRAAAMIAELL